MRKKEKKRQLGRKYEASLKERKRAVRVATKHREGLKKGKKRAMICHWVSAIAGKRLSQDTRGGKGFNPQLGEGDGHLKEFPEDRTVKSGELFQSGDHHLLSCFSRKVRSKKKRREKGKSEMGERDTRQPKFNYKKKRQENESRNSS